MKEKCVICGEYEEDHHVFTPPNRPSKSCCCNPKDWSDPEEIPAVCGKFVGDRSGNCETCEHDYECHAE